MISEDKGMSVRRTFIIRFSVLVWMGSDTAVKSLLGYYVRFLPVSDGDSPLFIFFKLPDSAGLTAAGVFDGRYLNSVFGCEWV